jgi:hypothetical protein
VFLSKGQSHGNIPKVLSKGLPVQKISLGTGYVFLRGSVSQKFSLGFFLRDNLAEISQFSSKGQYHRNFSWFLSKELSPEFPEAIFSLKNLIQCRLPSRKIMLLTGNLLKFFAYNLSFYHRRIFLSQNSTYIVSTGTSSKFCNRLAYRPTLANLWWPPHRRPDDRCFTAAAAAVISPLRRPDDR